MVQPTIIDNGNHQNFLCGNDPAAKEAVVEILMRFGWTRDHLLDLGDITHARGTEAYLLLWTRIYGATQNGAFNMKLARTAE